MKLIYLKNFRCGFATNSSSTHSIIYKNKDDMFNDLNVFELNYYDRYDNTIAASKEAKIKYIATNINWNKSLLDIMSAYYPQMKEYAKESDFGMTSRGYLGIGRNMEASVFFLKNVIEDEEIIIVGGSDEEDFVYNTCKGHRKSSDSKELDWKSNVYKNGNYWIGYSMWGSRLRFMTEPGECVPEHPELVDLKITDMCRNNCKFCYAGSTSNGHHADREFLSEVIRQLSTTYEAQYERMTEFAIGGGNPLEHPQFDEIVEIIKNTGNIVNVTINVSDIPELIKNKKRIRVFKKNIRGIGVSLTDVSQVKTLVELKNKLKQSDCRITVHLIPEMIGADMVIAIRKEMRKHQMFRILFLGYKNCGRGTGIQVNRLTDDDLNKIAEQFGSLSIDTAFANTYKKWLQDNIESFPYTVTLNEGEFSMFIDGVNKKAYKSSYQCDKGYSLESDGWENQGKTWFTVDEAFAMIREDGGFKVYKRK